MKPRCLLLFKKSALELSMFIRKTLNFLWQGCNTTFQDNANLGRFRAEFAILSFAVIAGLSGCATEQKCLRKYPPQIVIHDSISYREKVVLKDTLIKIYIPGEVVHDSIPVVIPTQPGKKITTKKIVKDTKLAIATAQVVNNVLYLTLTQKDTTIEEKLTGAIREATYWENKYHSVEATKIAPNRPAFIRGLVWGIISGIILIVLLLYLLVRLRPKA